MTLPLPLLPVADWVTGTCAAVSTSSHGFWGFEFMSSCVNSQHPRLLSYLPTASSIQFLFDVHTDVDLVLYILHSCRTKICLLKAMLSTHNSEQSPWSGVISLEPFRSTLQPLRIFLTYSFFLILNLIM